MTTPAERRRQRFIANTGMTPEQAIARSTAPSPARSSTTQPAPAPARREPGHREPPLGEAGGLSAAQLAAHSLIADEVREHRRREAMRAAAHAGLGLPPRHPRAGEALLEQAGAMPVGETPADRLINSATYGRWCEHAGGTMPPVRVLAGDEVGDYLKAAITVHTPLSREALRVDLPPAGANVPSLIDIDPVGADLKLTRLAVPADPVGAGMPPVDTDGSVELVATVSTAQQQLFGWRVHVNLQRRHDFADRTVARRSVNLLLEQVWTRTLEAELLTGTGATIATRRQLLGITNVPGVNTFARTTETRNASIVRGSRLIAEDGWVEPDHVVVANPVTLEAIFTEPASAGGEFLTLNDWPLITGWTATTKLPNGTAIVGSWRRGCTLYTDVDGVMLEMRADHSDYFVKGQAALQAENMLFFDCHSPTAFAVITGL